MNKRLFLFALMLALAGCHKPNDDRVQGYVEGEFVHAAFPMAGELEVLAVHRGDQVVTGTALFHLESASEKAARDQAARRLEEGVASLADAEERIAGQRDHIAKRYSISPEQRLLSPRNCSCARPSSPPPTHPPSKISTSRSDTRSEL